MKLSNKQIITILSALSALDLAVGTGQVKITEHMIPAAYIDTVKDWASFLAMVLGATVTVISGWSTDGALPKPLAAAAAIVFAFLVLFASPDSALAQQRPQVTGNLIADIKANNAAGVSPGAGLDAVWDKLKSVSIDDLQYAKKLADAVGSPRSKIRSTCYGAWITVIQQSQGVTAGEGGAPLGAPPDPALFTKSEQTFQVLDNLQPDSTFMVACQPASNMLKMTILQFVTTVAGGVTKLGALGLGIP